MNGLDLIKLFIVVRFALSLGVFAIGAIGVLWYFAIDEVRCKIADKRWIFNANTLNKSIDVNEDLFETIGIGCAPGVRLPFDWCRRLHELGCKKINDEPTWLVDKQANSVNLVVTDVKRKMFSLTFDKDYNAKTVSMV